MTAALTTDPTYALPGIVRVTVSTDTSANFVRLWVTDAPLGSDQRLAVDRADNARVEVAAVPVGDVVTMKLSKPGAYVFATQEYTRGGSTHGGGYAGDPNSYPTETKVGSEQSVSLYIGAPMSLRIGTPSRGQAELLVHVWNDTIRETTIATHGIRSPVIRNPTTTFAAAATNDSSVLASVASLVDSTATSMTANLDTLWEELVTDIPLHFANSGGSYHTNADTANSAVIDDLPLRPTSPEGWARAVASLARQLRLHFTNSGESALGGSRFHVPADYINLAILNVPSESGSDMASVFESVSRIYQSYEAHRLESLSHLAVDTTNAITTSLDKTAEVSRSFAASISVLQPDAAPSQHPGALRLAGIGYREV